MTKYTLLPLFGLFLSALIPPAVLAEEHSRIDFCRDLSYIARDAMTARQFKDVPMSENLPKTISRIEQWAEKYGVEIDAEEAEKSAAEMVMHAYRADRPAVDKYKKERVSDFENEYFEDCYRELTDEE